MSKTRCPDMNYKLNLPVGVYRVRFDGCFGATDFSKIKYVFHLLEDGFENKNVEIIFPWPNESMKNKDEVLRIFYVLQCRLAGRKLELDELSTSLRFLGRQYVFYVGVGGLTIGQVGTKEVAHD